MNMQEVIRFIQAALECSVYLSPKEPGLTYDEILELGKQAGFQPGEIGDALPHAADSYIGHKMLLPNQNMKTAWNFFQYEEPDYRNFEAFDFVVSQLNALVRAEGARSAQLERNLMVERAAAQDIPRNDVEAAITISVMSGQLIEKDGILRFAHGQQRSLPSEQRSQIATAQRQPIRKEVLARAYPLVKDVIERRTDGRPQHAEPFDVFAEELDKLGYKPFQLWWKQTVGELRRGDPMTCPVSVSVLAAALVEGALTFVVKHARALNLGVFRSSDFDKDPRSWRIDDLVASAASGSHTAILDVPTKARADGLIRARQQIHAGRMLSEFPAGVPDLRPEEARDARATAELVVRRVLDWLQKFPPSGTSGSSC